jgi:hypothetical protein
LPFEATVITVTDNALIYVLPSHKELASLDMNNSLVEVFDKSSPMIQLKMWNPGDKCLLKLGSVVLRVVIVKTMPTKMKALVALTDFGWVERTDVSLLDLRHCSDQTIFDTQLTMCLKLANIEDVKSR